MVGRNGMYKHLVGCLVLTALLAGSARGSDIIRLYGEENVGTAAAQFLRIPVGARAVALAKAYSAVATDGSAPFWNPAGIMRTPGRKNFFFSHSEYAADINLDYAAVHGRRQNYGFGLMVGILNSGDILRTDELHQQGTGTYFNANQFFMGATLARAMTDRFSIGGTIKYFQENLDEFQTKTFMADLGILYYVGIDDFRIGFSVRNFGGDMQPEGTPPPELDGYVPATEFQKFPAPTVGSFGTAKTWTMSKNITLLTTADFNHPSDYQESFRFGGELGLNRMLFLRGGYETSRTEGGAAAGFGLQLKRQQFLLRIDYAFSDMGSFGIVHHISVDLSPLVRPKDSTAWMRRDR